MVKHIELKCPHCNQECDIFLTTSAYMIVLNCPRCWQPIMFHEDHCVSLNNEQIRQIEDAHADTDVQEVLQNISRNAPLHPATHGDSEAKLSSHRRSRALVHHPVSVQERQTITGDDITNLRIELAMCDTVEDFLLHM